MFCFFDYIQAIHNIIFGFKVSKRLSIWRRVVKELLKGINVPLGTFDAQYDIEKTSIWLLGGQRIFLRKSSYLRTPPFHTSHPIKFDMKMKFFLRFAGKSTLFAGKSLKNEF